MISGIVNANLEAMIRLYVAGPHGTWEEITAIIDTGYNGALTLPLATVTALGLSPSASRIVTLGDASQRVCDFFTANLRWEEDMRRIRILRVEGMPLVGTALLREYKLETDFIVGGSVTLTRLP